MILPFSIVTGNSQFGEDRRLLEIFNGSESGVCVEVGAFDGVTGSTTRAFELLGWTTILVEPVPELAQQIRRQRSGRVFEVAAGPSDSTVVLRRAILDPAISTVADTRWQNQLYALRSESWEEIRVRQLSLDRILEEAGVSRLDFATIDVEGYELEVLRGWDLGRWRPRVVILEDNSRGLDRRAADLMARAGYVCFDHTGVNDWYARLDDATLASPSARFRQSARLGYRRIRCAATHFAPAWLKRLLRHWSVAGE